MLFPIAVLLLSAVQRTHGEGAATTVRVLFPADQCTLEGGRFELVCALAPEAMAAKPRLPLRVDGRRGKWLPYAPPAFVARLELKAGLHEITVGSQKLRVYVCGEEPAPAEVAGWPVLRSHPGGADGWKDCGTCHMVTEGKGPSTIGDPQEPSACKQCHSSEDFQLAHFHPEKPLGTCHQCHALHGSTNEHLLRGPAKKLCAACHD
jgi:predicted CXXCH cytochrome family protein